MSVPLSSGDPAYWMLLDDFTSTPVVHRDGCYICEDKEFAQMGLPLCRRCPRCVGLETGTGHIAADDNVCDDCGYEDGPEDYAKPELVPAERPDGSGDPCPGKPCEFCTGNSAVVTGRGEDGKPVYMPSWEWCQSVNACAATIDWELIFNGR